jgi:homoserine dehydrogenase
MPLLNLCLLGFGNVNRTLVELLILKQIELRERYGITWRITGVASRRLGWLVNADGFEAQEMCGADTPVRGNCASQHKLADLDSWLKAARPDVIFEATSLNVQSGQPAIEHIRAALESGAHAITANKGPVVHAYHELRDLAAKRKRQFLFESTVMDGVPIFSQFRDTLPAIEVKAFQGILNSTTNVILAGMEEGLSFNDSLRRAQQLGVAETDATHDIDGWDAAVKVAALVTVLMNSPLKPQEVRRQGIAHLPPEAVREARAAGRPYKLICRAERVPGSVKAAVTPTQVPLTNPMAMVNGTSSIIRFETDIFPALTIIEENPGLYATAYGMLADFIRVSGSR